VRGNSGRPESQCSVERCCSPAQGTDVNGPTATIKSVSTLEHINLVQGTIFNMKMHPGALETQAGMAKWANLIRTTSIWADGRSNQCCQRRDPAGGAETP